MPTVAPINPSVMLLRGQLILEEDLAEGVQVERTPPDVRRPEAVERHDEQRRQRQYRRDQDVGQQERARSTLPTAERNARGAIAFSADRGVPASRDDPRLQRPGRPYRQDDDHAEPDGAGHVGRVGEGDEPHQADREHLDACPRADDRRHREQGEAEPHE
jgi:hypothetical protein